MKLKVFFLGMFAAAALMSCNNDVLIDGPDGPNRGLEGTGESTHATFNLNFKGGKGTYAGSEEFSAEARETAVADAAVYIYKWDGANMAPEAMAYLTAGSALGELGSPESVTLMVKNGWKKIFVACNIGHTPAPALLVANGGAFTTAIDTGVVLGTNFSALNQILYSTATNVALTAPASGTVNGGSAGLIRALAGGSITQASGVLFSTTAYSSTTGSESFCLMTNWDGPDDLNTGGYDYPSKCLFELLPNISAATSKAGGQNHVEIGVQRAFAKISLRITADNDIPSNSATAPYYSSEEDGSKGRFTPWTNSSSESIWSLGGINKSTRPFQVFAGTQSAVASPNYALATGDTIFSLTPTTSDLWYDNYDNTRVFGTTKVYYTNSNTVANVKTTMETAGNNLALSPANAGTGTPAVPFNFAMCTENGTEFPQLHDKGTYVIVGGVYAPKNVLTDLDQSGVTTNAPEKGWNGATPVVNVSSTGYDVNTYFGLTYGATGSGTDTLYYLVAEKVFIFGTENLHKYYAWELQLDKDETDPYNNVNAAVANAINIAKTNNALFGYYLGQCFYRVWVKDPQAALTSSAQDEVLVRRNHVYDINISKIKGPGIADPNSIIKPGEPIPELDTFVTAEINILDWHKVNQDAEVSYN